MDPATNPARARGGNKQPPAVNMANGTEGDGKYKFYATERQKMKMNQATSTTYGRERDQHQPSTSGLRQNTNSREGNNKMPAISGGLRGNKAPRSVPSYGESQPTTSRTAIERIQAYKAPAYVSPYGGTQSTGTAPNKIDALPIRGSKPPRRSSDAAPSWLCCFAQKSLPEWSRHAETWNPGTENTCTDRTTQKCQHQKCKDCLWESSEEQVRVQDQALSESMGSGAEVMDLSDDEPLFVGTVPARKTPMDTQMDPPSERTPPWIPPWSRGFNRDPRTGRPRLWERDGE